MIDSAKVDADNIALLQHARPWDAMHHFLIDRSADHSRKIELPVIPLEIRGGVVSLQLAGGQCIEFSRRHSWFHRMFQRLQNFGYQRARRAHLLSFST